MKIAIIGTGHVGLITGVCFAEKGHQVICIDNNKKKIRQLKSGRMPIYEPGLAELVRRHRAKKRISFSDRIRDGVVSSKIIFIAVGTPLAQDGSADLSYIEGVCHEIARHLPVRPAGSMSQGKEYRVIVEKSTVPVATGERIKKLLMKYAPGVDFDIVSNPEFLQEGKAIQTTLFPDRIVIGVENKRAETIIRRLYKGFKAPLLVTDLASAELIKHAANSFLAMKISYINALARICELVNADVTKVARGMGLDKRIGSEFLKAGIGYGGYCFPKDIAAFARFSEQWGYDFELLQAVRRINQTQRDYFIKKIEEELGVIKGKTIGFLGLAFKPRTDDIRESPALEIARRLIKLGAKIQAYDPQAIPNAKQVLKKGIKYGRSAYAAARRAHCLVIATDWSEFQQLNFRRIKNLLLHPTIIDGRNILDPQQMQQLGFVYRSVGRM